MIVRTAKTTTTTNSFENTVPLNPLNADLIPTEIL